MSIELKPFDQTIDEAKLNHKLQQEVKQAQAERSSVLQQVCLEVGIDWMEGISY